MRKRVAQLALAALSLAWSASPAFAQALQPIPELRARVTDLTGTLSAAERAALEQKLAAFEARKGAQVAVLIVPTTQPEEIEQYGIRVAEAWKLGRAESDDGALLLVAKDDRALRIEVGYGLEGALSDARANRIIDETIVPRFRAGEFAAGIDAGVDRMLAVIDGEELPPPQAAWESREPSGFALIERTLPFMFLAVPIAGGLLRRLFGRALGPVLAGALVFALVWLVTRVVLIALAFALITALFSALSGRRPRGHFRRGDHAGWGGGFGSGGFSGGGGFGGGGFGGGGFSGGGGGFGGGGASGRW